MAAAAGLTSVAQLQDYTRCRDNRRWTSWAAEALSYADDHSASPQETRMRLVWVLVAGLPRPLCNRPVFSTSGELLGIPDLLDPQAGLVVEYDGADHLTARRRHRDVRREEAFRDHGLDYLTVLSPDLHERQRLARRMRESRARAEAALDLRPRHWTLDPRLPDYD